MAERRRLASRRAAFAARLGLVRFRGFATTSAAATTSHSRSVAASRFRSYSPVAQVTSSGGHSSESSSTNTYE